jgi:hypothetical protein
LRLFDLICCENDGGLSKDEFILRWNCVTLRLMLVDARDLQSLTSTE